MLVVGKVDRGGRLYLSARVQGDRAVEDILSVHASDPLPPEPGPYEMGLRSWISIDARSLL